MQVTPIQRIFSSNAPAANNYNNDYLEMLISKILETKLQKILSNEQRPLLKKPATVSIPYTQTSYRPNNVIVPYASNTTTNWTERIIFFIMGIFISILFLSFYRKFRN